jgi:hypothetical protein
MISNDLKLKVRLTTDDISLRPQSFDLTLTLKARVSMPRPSTRLFLVLTRSIQEEILLVQVYTIHSQRERFGKRRNEVACQIQLWFRLHLPSSVISVAVVPVVDDQTEMPGTSSVQVDLSLYIVARDPSALHTARQVDAILQDQEAGPCLSKISGGS